MDNLVGKKGKLKNEKNRDGKKERRNNITVAHFSLFVIRLINLTAITLLISMTSKLSSEVFKNRKS
jgi:uncharacterized protein Veg